MAEVLVEHESPDWRRGVYAVCAGLEPPWSGRCLLPPGLLPDAGRPWSGQPDGNRSWVADEPGPAGWRWSVKGVGARQPMWGENQAAGPRVFAEDSWYGEAPWGAQGEEGARHSLALSDEAAGFELFGMPICPVVAIARLPAGLPTQAARYRRHPGGMWQELRLVPSRIRLGDQAERTLAFQPDAALASLGVRDLPSLDAFIERLLQSGLAALTLPARSARPAPERGPRALSALCWSHVWLDKDSLLHPDGRLCFADLEGVERRPLPDLDALLEQSRRHLDEHVYELLYAVDRLLALADRWRGAPDRAEHRAAALALRLDLALQEDPWLRLAPRRDGHDLAVRCPLAPDERILLPFLDAGAPTWTP